MIKIKPKNILVLLIVLFLNFDIIAQPSWSYINTGNAHTILVQQGTVTIDSVSVPIGTFVGAFYSVGNSLVCGGYFEYTGSNYALTIWGDDVQTSLKDGFDTGEIINWKVWIASDSTEFSAIATYLQPPTMPNTDMFVTNGMSGLVLLEAFSVDYQFIILPQGWSYFSSYIDVLEPDFDSLFDPILSNVIIAKNGEGYTYWPLWGINLIGDIVLGEGYQVKMLGVSTLVCAGLAVDPFTTQIIIPQGWSIMGYLRQESNPISDMMEPIDPSVIIIKSSDGGTYWPAYGVDLIGNMVPGEGYQIKLNSQQAFVYSGPAVLPTIESGIITSITSAEAVFGGNVINDGGGFISSRGVCWNMLGSPTILDSFTIDSVGSGSFISFINGLSNNTTYYVRAYATNYVGTSYSSEVVFTTTNSCDGLNVLIDIDGNNYSIVPIGGQCWMAENLITTHYPDGTSIPLLSSGTSWASLYDNNTDDGYCINAYLYGALYSWAAAMGDNAIGSSSVPSGVQGACPTGWHLPSDDEWKVMELYLGVGQYEIDDFGYRGTNQGSQLAGNFALWEAGDLRNTSQFGSSGFNGIPGGLISYNAGAYQYISEKGNWWTSSEYDGYEVWSRHLHYSNSEIGRFVHRKSGGLSVRCIKD